MTISETMETTSCRDVNGDWVSCGDRVRFVAGSFAWEFGTVVGVHVGNVTVRRDCRTATGLVTVNYSDVQRDAGRRLCWVRTAAGHHETRCVGDVVQVPGPSSPAVGVVSACLPAGLLWVQLDSGAGVMVAGGETRRLDRVVSRVGETCVHVGDRVRFVDCADAGDVGTVLRASGTDGVWLVQVDGASAVWVHDRFLDVLDAPRDLVGDSDDDSDDDGGDVVTCDECGERTTRDDALDSGSVAGLLCETCGGLCEFCDAVFVVRDDGSEFADSLCVSCARNVRVCHYCQERYDSLVGGSRVNGEHNACDHCLQDFAFCQSCDEFTTRDVCAECSSCSECECSDDCRLTCDPFTVNMGGDLLPYDYKPDNWPTFGAGPLFFGVEIEFETNDAERYRSDIVSQVAGMLGRRAFLKHDGSLENGCEIVTYPADLDTFRGWTGLDDVLAELRSWGCNSWNGHRCGFHVHLTRDAFQDATHLFAFALFFYRNREQVRTLSGRRDYELDRWASLNAHQGTGDDYPRLIDKVRGRNASTRYSAVNLTNDDTVEIRVFRGSLRSDTLRGCVDLCAAAFHYCAALSSRDVRDGFLSWDAFRRFAGAAFPAFSELAERRGV